MKALQSLFGKPARPAAAPIGVDFAAERLNMLQVEPSADGLAVRAAVDRKSVV